MDWKRGVFVGNIERVLPFRSRGRALAIYVQLSKEPKAGVEQIKQDLINVYATDAVNAYDQVITRQLRRDGTVEEFLLICEA